ncbi:MAG: chromosomal replication initiator protein DnaA [Dysgonamonadaceae bacterium]|jgi:chromosomal replication initiator protein|nr:chromosomal replication initiator protein DnaA [Dysgonamonadaceae bacterium]
MNKKEMHLEIWNQCLIIIKDNINNESVYNTWFSPIKPLKYDEENFTIQVPSQFFYEYLDEKYADLIHATLSRIIGKPVILNYRAIIDNNSKEDGQINLISDHIRNDYPQASSLNKAPDNTIKKSIHDWVSNLNNRMTFNNYFEGQSNKLPRTIGETVAQNPSKNFNPLFIYGRSGVGKTHLCHAIGNKIVENFPQKKVIYISSHLFQVQFTDASRKNISNDFITFYQEIDVLIIDDIQDMAGKTATLNAFFHILSHLLLLGKQIVLTADKSPTELQNMEDRLLTRFKRGMTAELHKPDIELRKKILNHKIKQDGLTISNEIVDYIAGNVTDHVRDLEGIITSLIAYSLVFNKDVDLELAKRVVSKAIDTEKSVITMEKIEDVVSGYFNIELKDIHSKSRKREIVQARQIIMYLLKKYTNYSYAHIGCVVGKRDHATVIHSERNVKNLRQVDKKFRSTLEKIEDTLKE